MVESRPVGINRRVAGSSPASGFITSSMPKPVTAPASEQETETRRKEFFMPRTRFPAGPRWGWHLPEHTFLVSIQRWCSALGARSSTTSAHADSLRPRPSESASSATVRLIRGVGKDEKGTYRHIEIVHEYRLRDVRG